MEVAVAISRLFHSQEQETGNTKTLFNFIELASNGQEAY